MTHNPINALNITIKNTKHTQNTKTHFQKSKIFGKFKIIFSKKEKEKKKFSSK